MTTSKPLRGTSRDNPSTSGRSGSRPNRGACQLPRLVVDRTEPFDVDAGRDDDARQRRPRPRTASRAGYVPAATMPAAPRSTRRANGRDDRHPAVAGDLGAVRDDDVRRRRRGAARAARAGSSGRGTRRPRRTSRASASIRSRQPPRRQQHAGAHASMRNAWSRSHAAASGKAVVSTVVSAGGSRRHSSYRYDWIPPCFGGKSFVTNNDGTRTYQPGAAPRHASARGVGRLQRDAELGAAADTQLGERPLQMVLHGAFGDAQALRRSPGWSDPDAAARRPRVPGATARRRARGVARGGVRTVSHAAEQPARRCGRFGIGTRRAPLRRRATRERRLPSLPRRRATRCRPRSAPPPRREPARPALPRRGRRPSRAGASTPSGIDGYVVEERRARGTHRRAGTRRGCTACARVCCSVERARSSASDK